MPKMSELATKFDQVAGLIIIGIAFAFNQPWLILVTFLIMLLGLRWPEITPLRLLYRQVFLKTGLLKPHTKHDTAAHRFAAEIGTASMGLSSICLLLLHFLVIGWVLALLVALFMSISVFLNF